MKFRGEGGGGYSIISPKQICAAKQGMVFRVVSLKQGLQPVPLFGIFYRVCFKLQIGGLHGAQKFFQKIQFHDISLKITEVSMLLPRLSLFILGWEYFVVTHPYLYTFYVF